jgi:4'-phosphopantetheinyl transferase
MDLQREIWQTANEQPSLNDGEIHVWRADLNQNFSTIQKFSETLSADEKQKAAKFRFEKDRNHFIAARGSLRKILGGYLGIAPNKICFSYNRFGKPFLDARETRIRFNVAHSNGLALFAISRGQEIGVDLEYIVNNFEILKTARSFFSDAEMSVLKNLPENLQTAAFFSGWTRKEAFIKAVGRGVLYPTKQFTVSIMPEDSNISLQTNEFQNWSVMNLNCQSNYKAALAVEGKIQTIRYWQSQN